MFFLNKKLIAGVFTFALSLTTLVGCSGANNSSSTATGSETGAKGTLLKAIMITSPTMMTHTNVTDSTYDKYFREGTAAAGVPNILSAGKYYVNGIAIPATATECTTKFPSGYMVEQVPWLYYNSTSAAWVGGYYKKQVAAASYEAAALSVATGIQAGNEIRLYDTDGDGYADLIEADYKEAVWVDTITNNGDGTYSVYRGDIDEANKTTNEGTIYDGSHFTATSGEKIKKADLDATIAPGDIAIFWYGPDGWTMQRATEVKGIFVQGADHVSYEMDSAAYGDVTYGDMMGFSRDNLSINMRPGEFTNAQNYFGFTNNGEGLTVSLWLGPSTDSTVTGPPVGLTTNSNAKIFLAEAIAIANQDLSSITVSTDGTDVATTSKWVTQAEYNQLDAAILRAKTAMESSSSSSMLLDYQTYLLYLTLEGNANDMGAKGGKFNYTGFMNEIQYGTK